MIYTIVIPTINPTGISDFVSKIPLDLQTQTEILIVSPGVDFSTHETIQASVRFITSNRIGRGYSCYEAAKIAKGEILLFLHDDTQLPLNWQKVILDTLRDPKVSGGGFSLTFDRGHWFLDLLTWCSDRLFDLTGELWGDRALFVRRAVLKEDPAIIDVPIMEDVRLSHFMKSRGKTRLMKEKVITSSSAFFDKGILKHTLIILICRFLFLIGVKPQKIYNIYYKS